MERAITPTSGTAPASLSGGEGHADRAARIGALLARPLDPAELRENARRIAKPEDRGVERPVDLLVFRLGGERLGLRSSLASRVAPRCRVRRLPHRRGEVFAGICSVEGRLVLAARLERLLGLAESTAAAEEAAEEHLRRTVVIEDGRGPWAFVADRVEGVRRSDAARFRPPPVTVAAAMGRFTEALAPLRDGEVTLLDGAAVLDGLERCLA